jgi:hypothetical protein
MHGVDSPGLKRISHLMFCDVLVGWATWIIFYSGEKRNLTVCWSIENISHFSEVIDSLCNFYIIKTSLFIYSCPQ